MAAPSRVPPHSTPNSLITDFSLHPAFHQQLSTTPDQLSSQDPFALGTSFTSAHIPLQHQSTTGPNQETSPSVILDDNDFLHGNDQQAIQHRTSHLLQDLTDEFIPFANTHHDAAKSIQLSPWNPIGAVNTSMVIPSEHLLTTQQQLNKRPITDSGYAGSQKSRRIQFNNQEAGRPQAKDPSYPYNEPLGSTAQQNLYLPEQQQRGPSTTIVTADPPPTPSSAITEPAIAPSGNQSYTCVECGDLSSTKSELSKHMARHNKKYKCDYPQCSHGVDGAGFATKNDLDRHKGSVHHDDTVTRREYRCTVAGCKDPNKVWDRKDNFKAHVVRMHPEMNPNVVVEQSFIRENQASINRTFSHTDTQSQAHGQSMYYPEHDHVQAFGPNHMAPYEPTINTGFDEGDMYAAAPNANQRQQMYLNQFDDGLYRPQILSQAPAFPPSATIASSNTMPLAHNSIQYEGVRPLIPYRENYMHVPYPHGSGSRPWDIHTAPPMVRNTTDDLQSHFFEWAGNYDAASIVGGDVSAIDPSLQTLESGAWSTSPTAGYPQQAEILDQPSQPIPAIVAEEQLEGAQGANECREAVLQQLLSMFEPLTQDQMKTVLEVYQRHPTVTNKDSCAVKSALDIANQYLTGEDRPPMYPCRRRNCGKSFSQNNIRVKHEKRHDRAFFCTWDSCYSTFGSKDDLRRHEKAHEKKKAASQDYQGWRCFIGDVPTSQYKKDCFKYFDNEDQFQQHRRNDHHERAAANNGGLKALKSCHVHQGQPGNFWCGFCAKVKQNEPSGTDGTKCDKFRYDHIDAHITKEGKTMDQWIDLKSEGLTKSEVRERQQEQTGLPVNDENDDDDDVDEPSPSMSATITGPSSQTPARYGRFLVPPVQPSGRKRSRSDADHIPLPVAKQPRMATHPVPRQAPVMSRGVSDMPNTGHASSSKRPPAAKVTKVVCCQCKHKADVGEFSCGHQGCFHQYCSYCIFWDNFGHRVFLKSNSGRGHGNKN